MKRVRKLFRFLCILTLAMSLTNCQHDTVAEIQQEEALQKEFPFKSSVLSKQEVEANTKLSNQMRSLATLQSSSLAESVYNETYNFTVDTDVVKFVESTENDSHSYTFPISRENNTGSALENLVFSYNATTDDYEASLVTYHFNASQQQEFLLTQHVRTPYEISYESIAVNLSDIVGETSLPCTTNYTEYHTTPDTGETFVHSSSIGNVNNECEHEDTSGNTSCTVYTIITTDCPVSGSSSGSPSSSSNSPTGGGNNSGNIYIPPTTPDEIPNVVTSPVSKDLVMELTSQLDDIFGIGNWETNPTNDIENTIQLNSIDELIELRNRVVSGTFETVASEPVAGQSSFRIDTNSISVSSFPDVDIVTQAKIEIPNSTNGLTRMRVINVGSDLDGLTLFYDWTQISSENPDDGNGPAITVNGNLTTIEIIGRMDFEVSILGFKFTGKDLIKVVLVYDNILNEFQPQLSGIFYI
ncbi:hypothetical protein IMCC3317_11140 [Kordia antarctica]|uniref:Uncharacterized protein n=1 Tax=Kordia antarctica TaxID=1218801 RepID=A0A7L4ZHS4_9FLAO|nr:hypothetical protein [Kordia antarctica]QHI35766.1 hypothetical protein IMCC3317_11140 [Kordia antarctica]